MGERDNWNSGGGEELEKDIQAFCEACDNYKPPKVILGIHLGNECKVLKPREQALAVNNGLCNKAKQNGWEGKMEQKDIFQPATFTARLDLNPRRKW